MQFPVNNKVYYISYSYSTHKINVERIGVYKQKVCTQIKNCTETLENCTESNFTPFLLSFIYLI